LVASFFTTTDRPDRKRPATSSPLSTAPSTLSPIIPSAGYLAWLKSGRYWIAYNRTPAILAIFHDTANIPRQL
jgi:hypothetical protein